MSNSFEGEMVEIICKHIVVLYLHTILIELILIYAVLTL